MDLMKLEKAMQFMMRERLRHVNMEFIERRIDEIRNGNFIDADVDALKFDLHHLFRVYTMSPLSISAGVSVYRARRHNEHETKSNLAKVGDLFPTVRHCTKLGRCNRIGSPAYYLSTDEATAILELRPNVGDIITVLRSTVTEGSNAELAPLGIRNMCDELNIKIGGTSQAPSERQEMLFGGDLQLKSKFDLIEAFLEAEFLKVVADDQPHLYKSTVAIAEKALSFDNVLRVPIEGIAYPSLSSIPGTANLAVSPGTFSKLFRPAECKRVVISEVKRPMKGLGLAEDIPAKEILNNGIIVW